MSEEDNRDQKTTLSQDQQNRIAATLGRIRDGLRTKQAGLFEEPAHLFEPEVF